MTNYQFTGGTICAPATIPGTGAISIIRVSGKEALAIADKVIDTAGIRETDETIEKIGIDRTFKKLGDAAVVPGMTDFILSKVNEMGDVKNVAAGSDGAETGGAALTETDETTLAERGGAALRGGAGQERKVVILVNKCDIAGSFYNDLAYFLGSLTIVNWRLLPTWNFWASVPWLTV